MPLPVIQHDCGGSREVEEGETWVYYQGPRGPVDQTDAQRCPANFCNLSPGSDQSNACRPLRRGAPWQH